MDMKKCDFCEKIMQRKHSYILSIRHEKNTELANSYHETYDLCKECYDKYIRELKKIGVL